MSIVVTGATGHLGRLVVEALLRRGVDPTGIVAAGRAVERLDDLAGRGVRVARIEFAAKRIVSRASGSACSRARCFVASRSRSRSPIGSRSSAIRRRLAALGSAAGPSAVAQRATAPVWPAIGVLAS